MTQWIVASITTVGAIVAAIFAYRASVSQSKPGAQQVINDGFANLVRELKAQVSELSQRVETVTDDATTARALARRAAERAENDAQRISRLEGYERRASGWHRRHRPFDEGAKKILEAVAPDELSALPALETFPVWRDDN